MSAVEGSGKPLVPRQVALRRHELRKAWLLLLAGLIVPVFALLAAAIGLTLREQAPRQAWALFTVGTAIFVVRMAIYLL